MIHANGVYKLIHILVVMYSCHLCEVGDSNGIVSSKNENHFINKSNTTNSTVPRHFLCHNFTPKMVRHITAPIMTTIINADRDDQRTEQRK